MIATAAPATITPAAFGRIVAALTRQFAGLTVGVEWLFMVAPGYEVVAWVPRAGHLTLQIRPFDGAVIRTVTVCPGADRPFDVVSGRVVLGETRGVDAALSLALDHLVAPLLAAHQCEHDAFAV